MKRIAALLLTLVLVIGLCACGNTNTNQNTNTDPGTNQSGTNTNQNTNQNQNTNTNTPSQQGNAELPTTLHVGLSSEPASLDPQNTGFNGGISMTGSFIYDTLLSWNSDTNTVEPNVITEWEWTDDVTLKVKIRNDIVSHDGYPITTEDVAYMFERGCACTGLSRYYSDFDPAKCEIINDYEMKIGLKNPSPSALTNMTLISFAVQSKKGFEAAGGTDVVALSAPSATGRYVLKEWMKGNQAVLVRNENYWGEPAPYETVTIKYLTDASSRLMALQSGDVDAIDRIAASEATLVENDPKLTLYEQTNVQNMYGVYLNCAHAPLDNAKVRKAMSMAVNRDALLKSVFFGRGTVSNGIFTEGFPLYSAPASGEEFVYDMEGAKKLLEEAGYGDGFEMTIITSQTQAYLDIAQFCQAAWGPLNIKVNIASSDSATFFSNKNAGEYDAYVLAATGVNYVNFAKDYDNRLDYARSGSTQFNPYDEAAFHGYIDILYKSLNSAEYLPAAAAVQSVIRAEAPSISLVNTSALFATKTSVAGVKTTCMGESNFSGLYPVA